MGKTNPNWTDTRNKPMTDIEQILNQHRRKQRIIDAIVITCVMVAIGVVLCVG